MKTKLPVLALAALLFAGLPLASSSAHVGISVTIAPPGIPIYEQPYAPGPGYIWTPGYWAYSDFGYYWVPGTWVVPPRIGYLWTPGYWGYSGGNYLFYDGYWGSRVGFYGGINYGYGYTGYGYYGGRWAGNTFLYNTAANRINTSVITTTYADRAPLRNVGSRAGFNGPGGAKARATKQQQAAAKAEHIPATSAQQARVEAAKNNPALHAKNNRGKPKADAIKALDRNNGQASPAAAGNGAAKKQARAEKRAGAQTGAETQARGRKQTRDQKPVRAQKVNGRAAQDASRSRPMAKSNRAERAPAPRAREAKKSNRNGAIGQNAPRTVRRAPVETRRPQAARQPQMTHRPQGAKVRQAGSAPRGRGPASAAQPGKKKKEKKPGQ